MVEITYLELVLFITALWVIVRGAVALKKKSISFKRELLLILVYICFIVIARFVNFPLHRVNGHIDTMKLDFSKIFPLWVNLIPIAHLFDVYDGWIVNIIGNITMFIPVGIVWPVCFKELNTWGKAFLAGAGFTLFIEITQLPFYERCSDVDDLILNSLGAAIGAAIFFGIKKLSSRKRNSEANH